MDGRSEIGVEAAKSARVSVFFREERDPLQIVVATVKFLDRATRIESNFPTTLFNMLLPVEVLAGQRIGALSLPVINRCRPLFCGF